MRSIRLIRLALAAVLVSVSAAPAAVHAQDTTVAPAAAAQPTPSAPVTAAPTSPSGASSGLPVTSGPPRTLRAYWHVFIAFTIVWLLVFGYAISLGRRFGRLERELDARSSS